MQNIKCVGAHFCSNECSSVCILQTFQSGLHSLMSKANQNSARHSVSKSYFTNIAVQHIIQAFVYIMAVYINLIN